MLTLHLSQAEVIQVNIERKKHKSPIIRDRMYVLHLLHLGYCCHEIAKIVGCHYNTVCTYIDLYRKGGLHLIKQLNYSYPKHELKDKFEQVTQFLQEAKCSTLSDAQELLKTRFNYHRSLQAISQLLKTLGIKRRKVGVFPGKPNNFEKWQEQQEAFITLIYQRLRQAEKGEIDLIFSDAAHFVYGKFSRYCWSKKACYAASGHGRYRINVYGSYDPITNGVYTMYNQGYVDAEFIAQYLEWLRKNIYNDHQKPLYFILDNARYQHCNYVKNKAEKLNIVLDFLPSYSPNLNLIERLWKYLKTIVAKQYHDGEKSFQSAIVKLLSSLGNKEHQSKIWQLLNPKFQKFEKSQILGL